MSPPPVRPPAPLTEEGFSGRRALVMGLGSFGGGVGAARYLAALGARVTVTDLGQPEALAESLRRIAELDVRTVLGVHREEDFEDCDLLVVNPAVAPDHPLIERARRSGARVTSEIELFLRAVRGRVACVTGTQGKSSTCSMLASSLEACGLRVHLGGNIGTSLLEALPSIGPADVVVLELSSYQLQALDAPPALAETVAITNVLSDHLERHGSLAAYTAAKARILALTRPGGTAFLPAGRADLRALAPAGVRTIEPLGATVKEGFGLRGGVFLLDGERLGRAEDLSVPGDFQRENAALALALARALGAPAERLAAAVPRLRGLPHRLEDLGWHGGLRVVDNGVSTTPDSTVAALASLPPGLTWIAGGRLKRCPPDALRALGRAAERSVGLAVGFGEGGAELRAASPGVPWILEPELETAVDVAFARTPPGATVLFSPAAASFDAYPNFRARALAFRAALPGLDRP